LAEDEVVAICNNNPAYFFGPPFKMKRKTRQMIWQFWRSAWQQNSPMSSIIGKKELATVPWVGRRVTVRIEMAYVVGLNKLIIE